MFCWRYVRFRLVVWLNLVDLNTSIWASKWKHSSIHSCVEQYNYWILLAWVDIVWWSSTTESFIYQLYESLNQMHGIFVMSCISILYEHVLFHGFLFTECVLFIFYVSCYTMLISDMESSTKHLREFPWFNNISNS